MSNSHPKVAVVGSLNIDYVAQVDRLPVGGETVPAKACIRHFGGKGANQALAAARQGVAVNLIGCVGNDQAGHDYKKRLRSEKINIKGISTTPKALTGLAMIAVDRTGENTIIVDPGANGELNPEMVRKQGKQIVSTRILLLQFEVSLSAAVEALRLANRAGVPAVINPSPLRHGFPWGKVTLDTVIVNALESNTIFGLSPNNKSAWRRRLANWRMSGVIITRGAQPTVYISAAGSWEIPTLKVKPVDTVGAGDTFAGTYAARRAEGLDVLVAIRYANCAAALATLKPGAQEAIPSRTATEKAFRTSNMGLL